MGYQAKYRRTGSKRPVLRALAISALAVLLVLAGTVFLAYRHLEGNITVSPGFDQITAPRPREVEIDAAKRPVNILVLGSDTRAGQTQVLGKSAGLSDTTILLHLAANRERAYGVSVPRDLMVPRPACKRRDGDGMVPAADIAQWNDAFALGGEACTIAQFEMMTHLRVNHFVIVDFNGFKSMVDALGGVPVCLPKEVNDTVGKIHLPAGSYEVTGDQALDYVRARHAISVSGDDISRIKRQQAFLASMVHKAVSAKTLFNPGRLLKFLDAATRSLTMDPGLAKLTDLFRLAQELRGIGLDKVQFLTVPIATYKPDPYRIAVGPGTDKLWGQLRRDEVLDRQFTSGGTNASEGKPGSGKPKPGDAAEAAANGLCA